MSRYHDILGVKPGANEDDIKKAYRKKAIETHPDKGGNEEEFKKITEAYEILTGKKEEPKPNFGGNPFGGNPFGNPFGRSDFRMKSRPLSLEIELTVEEVFFGCVKQVNFYVDRSCINCGGAGATKFNTCNNCGGRGMHVQNAHGMQTFMMCNNCGGSGRMRTENCNSCSGFGVRKEITSVEVTIPRGMSDGARMVITGAGNDVAGAHRGDVFLGVKVKPHPKYTIEGLNILQTEEIPFVDMVLGQDLEIKSLAGNYKISIPKNCESNKIFRLKGQGIKDEDTGIIGDLHIKAVTKIPKTITEEERNLLLKLKETTNLS